MRMTPALTLVAALLIVAFTVVTALYIALHQPWMGTTLTISPSGGLSINTPSRYGPNSTLPADSVLRAIGQDRGEGKIPLVTTDVIEEPDFFDTFLDMDGFFHRQGQLHDILSRPTIYADLDIAGTPLSDAEISVSAQRPLASLPLVFWVQLFVGITGFFIAAWVWSLKRTELPTFFFALAGFGLMISATSAAIYSTRELALPETLFSLLSSLNHIGALTFGAGMIGLFLSYPYRLVGTGLAFLPSLLLAFWVAADWFRLLEGPPLARQLPIILAMATIAICVVLQFWKTRGDPRARAVLRWLGLSVLIGAGLFVLTSIVPELFGAGRLQSQGYSFLYFLIIYVGVALGVSRYRLFDLEEWAFRILFYMGGILLIVLLDVALVLIVSIEEVPAFSLSFVLVALFYLPFRDSLWRLFMSNTDRNREALFTHVVDIALTPTGKSQTSRWQNLLAQIYNPLDIHPAETSDRSGIEKEGLGMVIPAIGNIPALRLEYANQGRKLFSQRDQDLAGELISMLTHTYESRQAFEQGVAEERSRIARDMHDNIGAQLLGALHSRNAERKDGMIRASLSDLRDIINNLSHTGLSLQEVLADLRAETVDRVHNADIALQWQFSGDENATLSPGSVHAFRSILREAISNVIRHSQAGQVSISVTRDGDAVALTIEDDGVGFDPAHQHAGNGITNMRARIENLGGIFEMTSSSRGTRIAARLPLADTENQA
ncbi:Sensor histidine kinase LiaS [Thalassovita gelatinovora]|uniref:Sensor histidine kinase LiaS n=1 Tax=Thalassovita gelatinovora TaxID=53501 RepID=A0A0P1F532_THAGE|nr:ATP-binding protein [Thalassovita gelatinovora]QIZ79471.1 histidine kinase [Thalassovita gelatinovora]CUH62844.1 Sensor histidine kinase LiaS [Thalassovita gelatinovora]SEQ11437.1 Histidine kinase-, DNA gyrase B-, and HSP90-like ATPase [Thalassovita gelatinovora]